MTETNDRGAPIGQGEAPWAARSVPSAAPEKPRRAFRPEIQGLRALAVLLVAVYHIWFGRVSGGVDVFLFISAFLMTLSFTGKLERGTPIRWKELTKYWVHVFKRILPVAILTVVGVLVATRFFLGAERWLPTLHEALSVVLYYENWFSIFNSVDYYAADTSAASPLRHFWSLSIQGQIFLMWPLLFAIGGFAARLLRLPIRATLAFLFGCVFVASLTYSVIETATNQQEAYFNTFTRLWEFALGSLVAIVLPWIKLPGGVRGVMTWVGVVAILICGAVLDVEGMFPGYIALWPTLAASLVIIAGQTGTRWGADRLLSWKPLVSLGSYSYALYLLHWPLLVFYLDRVRQEKADFFSGVGLLVVALVGSILITRLVDTPLRSWKWSEARRWRSLVVVAGCMALGLGAVAAWQGRIVYVNDQIQANAWKNNPGAKILDPEYQYIGDPNPPLSPIAAERGDDFARYEIGPWCEDVSDMDLHGLSGAECFQTVENPHPDRSVIAIGNSHVEQWAPAIKGTAEEENWDFKMVGRGGCFYTTEQQNRDVSPECVDWFNHTAEFVEDQHPDVIFLQSTMTGWDGGSEWIPEGVEDIVRHWTDQGIQVVGIRDNPRFPDGPSNCAQYAPYDDCFFDHITPNTPDPTLEWSNSIRGYSTMDMNDLVCPDGVCPPAVGNVYTYIDNNHLTATFVRSTQDFFTERAVDAINWGEAKLNEPGDPTVGAGEGLPEGYGFFDPDEGGAMPPLDDEAAGVPGVPVNPPEVSEVPQEDER
jgi:peptidoglycan/LPS O-acetylase OafA/YrhL